MNGSGVRVLSASLNAKYRRMKDERDRIEGNRVFIEDKIA